MLFLSINLTAMTELTEFSREPSQSQLCPKITEDGPIKIKQRRKMLGFTSGGGGGGAASFEGGGGGADDGEAIRKERIERMNR